MQWYIDLIAIAVAAFLARLAAGLICGPIREAFCLRRESLARITAFRNIPLPKPRELAITSQEIRDYDRAVQNLRNIERIFADLGARFLSLSESEPNIRNLMKMVGLDTVLAGNELINLSQVYASARTNSGEVRNEIANSLQSTSTALNASRCGSRDGLIKIRLEPMHLRDAASYGYFWLAVGGGESVR